MFISANQGLPSPFFSNKNRFGSAFPKPPAGAPGAGLLSRARQSSQRPGEGRGAHGADLCASAQEAAVGQQDGETGSVGLVSFSFFCFVFVGFPFPKPWSIDIAFLFASFVRNVCFRVFLRCVLAQRMLEPLLGDRVAGMDQHAWWVMIRTAIGWTVLIYGTSAGDGGGVVLLTAFEFWRRQSFLRFFKMIHDVYA